MRNHSSVLPQLDAMLVWTNLQLSVVLPYFKTEVVVKVVGTVFAVILIDFQSNLERAYIALNAHTEVVGRAEFNVATPTKRDCCIQRTVIHKQNSFKITSRGFKVEPQWIFS